MMRRKNECQNMKDEVVTFKMGLMGMTAFG